MREFLEAVLPSTGWYVAGSGTDGANSDYKQKFFDTLDGVTAYATANLAKQRDVFFAVASFKEPTLREQANVLHLKALFQDFDLKSQTGISDIAELAARISAACDSMRIPRPTVVQSGGGYHCYWVLETPVAPDVWMQWNQRIAIGFNREGVAPDQNVRKDSARILRIPDTLNFKKKYPAPLPVVLVCKGKLCTLESFHSLSDITIPLPHVRGPVDALTASLAGGDFPPTSFKEIIQRSTNGKGCAQLLGLIATPQLTEEPMWRAGLSVAQVCEDRETAIRALSKGHPGYDKAASLAKAAATKGPYTCQSFNELQPGICGNCPKFGKLTSPVSLGRIIREADPEKIIVPKPLQDRSLFIEPPSAEAPPPPEPFTKLTHYQVQTPTGIVLVPKYLYPYFRGENGGVHVRKKGKGDDEEEVKEVCPYDYFMTHTMTDEATGDQFGVFRIVLPQDGVREMVLPMNECSVKDRIRDRVADKGMPLMPWQLDLFMEYTIKMVRDLTNNTRAQLVRSGMGWTDEGTFVVGEREYMKQGAVYCPTSAHTRGLAPYLKPKGSLDEWRKIADIYDKPGYELHAFTLFMGFGAPLLKLMNIDGGIISLVSPESGTGKTTSLMMVNSIFGHPKELLLMQKDTVNAKVQRMGVMRSMACCVDEVTNMVGTDLSEFVYGATQGRGKHRMEAASNMERINTTKWQLPTITSSNRSLTEALMVAKMVSQAEISRIIELDFSKSPRMEKGVADEIYMHKLFENYGVAGPVYMEYLLNNMDDVKRRLMRSHKSLDLDLKLDSSKRFWSALLAAALCGGTMARTLGLHNIDIGRVFAAITKEIGRNQTEANESNTDYEDVLGEFINLNLNNILVANPTWSEAPLREPKGKLVMRYEPVNKALFIPVRELRQFCAERQVNQKALLSTMEERGLYKGAFSKRLAASSMGGVTVPIMRCHQFTIGGIDFGESTEV